MCATRILPYSPMPRVRVIRRWAFRLFMFDLVAFSMLAPRQVDSIEQRAHIIVLTWRCEHYGADRVVLKPYPGSPVPCPRFWVQLEREMGDWRFDPPDRSPTPPNPFPLLRTTLFLHRCISPSGHSCLVAVEIDENGLLTSVVIQPGENWSANPRYLWHDESMFGVVADIARFIRHGHRDAASPDRMEMGKPDPDDNSHFTISFVLAGRHGIVDGKLCDNETIQLEVRNAPQLANGLLEAPTNATTLPADNLDLGVGIPRLVNELRNSPIQKWNEFMSADGTAYLPPEDNY
jgi:hypothetical protein